MYLLDTNVISEIRKGDGNPSVRTWFDSTDGAELFLSVLVLGEVQRGILMVRGRDPSLAASLQAWLDQLRIDYADRLLVIDNEVALEWGRLNAIRTVPAIDGLLAATASRYGMTLVTRNTSDFIGLNIAMMNPFG